MRDQLDLPNRPVLFLADFADAVGTWARLAAWLSGGAEAAKHPFHWPVVSTVAADGTPDARMVVLRRFDSASRTLNFHTDIRSPKVSQLRRDPRCHVFFYDPDAKLQLRVRTTAVIHHADATARREFDALAAHTRATYAAAGAAGDPLPADAPTDYPPRPPVDEAFAFGNFVAVVCELIEVDVLELHEHGHRRAKLGWQGGNVIMQRVGP